MADQRFSPRVLTTALWAARQAGMNFSTCFRPLAVIASSTRLPRPPPSAVTKPSRCNGWRFRTSVVRSIPSQSLNSAMFQLSLACNASRIGDCVARIPCRRNSASKNCVITRVTQRKLKHTQFSVTEKSSSFDITVCICTTWVCFVKRLLDSHWCFWLGEVGRPRCSDNPPQKGVNAAAGNRSEKGRFLCERAWRNGWGRRSPLQAQRPPRSSSFRAAVVARGSFAN